MNAVPRSAAEALTVALARFDATAERMINEARADGFTALQLLKLRRRFLDDRLDFIRWAHATIKAASMAARGGALLN